MRLQEPALDLALVAALLSSLYDIPLPERAVFWGEVDLNGQIRPVSGHDVRLLQAKRLGYAPIFHPGSDKANSGRNGVDTVMTLQKLLFRK